MSGELRHVTGTPPATAAGQALPVRDRGRRSGRQFEERMHGAAPEAQPAAVQPVAPPARRDPPLPADLELGGQLDVIA